MLAGWPMPGLRKPEQTVQIKGSGDRFRSCFEPQNRMNYLCLTCDEPIPQTTMHPCFVYGHCHDSDGRLVFGWPSGALDRPR
jgi:hypothetical protein